MVRWTGKCKSTIMRRKTGNTIIRPYSISQLLLFLHPNNHNFTNCESPQVELSQPVKNIGSQKYIGHIIAILKRQIFVLCYQYWVFRVMWNPLLLSSDVFYTCWHGLSSMMFENKFRDKIQSKLDFLTWLSFKQSKNLTDHLWDEKK